MQEISINELLPHPKNDYFFDNITGENWEAFLESIKTSGVIEPVIVDAKTKIIISGHQRVRACKELHIEKVMCDLRLYDNEDKILKDLLETNLRQRGIGNTNPIKLGRCLVELERIYGIQNGGDRKSDRDNLHLKKQNELADNVNITQRQLSDYKRLLTLIPELQELIETGEMSSTVGYKVWAKLSQEKQTQLVENLGTEVIGKMTQKQTQELVDQIKGLENQVKGYELKISSEPKIIDKTDYKKIEQLTKEKELLERKVKLNEQEAEKYRKLKSEIEFLTKEKEDLGRQINSATELASLTVRLQNLLEKDLAPIKYKRCMDVLNSSDVAVRNLVDIIVMLNKWVSEIEKHIPSEYKNKINIIY